MKLNLFSRNFQLSVAKKTLGFNQDRNDFLLSERRQAFSSLKAIKAGKKVTSVRTGHRVKDFMPGFVPQSSSAQRLNGGIQIYQVIFFYIFDRPT